MSLIIVIGVVPQSLINFRGDLLKEFVSHGHEVIAMAGEDSPFVRDQLNTIGVKFLTYSIKRNGMNPFDDIRTYLCLRKTFDIYKPDIILAYTIKPVIWSGFALKRKTKTRFYPLITGLGIAFNNNSNTFYSFLTWFITHLYRISLRKASHVIFQNNDDKNLFIAKHIINKEKCANVNGSGVDLNRFQVVTVPEQGIRFLTIGRLLKSKGFREYANAARLVKVLYPEVIFSLVGPEDPSPDRISQAEVQSWNDDGVIQYLGKTQDVRPFIADCTVYVLPSYHEGMPRTVLEAMAMGRPILTTDVPGCRETVINGQNGFLVPKADATALAERMIWFIENRKQLLHMGLASRYLAEERFDVHKINEKMILIMGLEDN